MKFLIFFVFIFCFITIGSLFAASSEYYVNDSIIEVAFQNADEHIFYDLGEIQKNVEVSPSNDEQTVAILYCVFGGWFALHRMYLGSRPEVIAYYCATVCGIIGIVPIIDFFVLAIEGVDSFIDSDKFFSW